MPGALRGARILCAWPDVARHGHLEARGAQLITGADQVITVNMGVRGRA